MSYKKHIIPIDLNSTENVIVLEDMGTTIDFEDNCMTYKREYYCEEHPEDKEAFVNYHYSEIIITKNKILSVELCYDENDPGWNIVMQYEDFDRVRMIIVSYEVEKIAREELGHIKKWLNS